MKTDFQKWAAAPPSWISASSGDIGGTVISSRVRIARNITGIPFPHNAAASGQKKVLASAFAALQSAPQLASSHAITLDTLSPIERTFLMERQLISHQHAQMAGEKGLVVSAGEVISVMINEEDHLRAACFRPGLGLGEAWDMLSQLDDDISRQLPYSFHPEFGFITACPTNMGTGLRASSLLHLPALVMTGQFNAVAKDLSELGLVVRGLYGEGTSALGDLFQVSNARTLGRTEANILREVEKTVKAIGALEQKEAQRLMSAEVRRQTEDRVFRALGTLSQARLLNYVEAMRELSAIRMGVKLRMEVGVSLEQVTNLFFLTQPAHQAILWGVDRSRRSEAANRAVFIRKRLKTNLGEEN